jgi:prophage tail gpP-like protein
MAAFDPDKIGENDDQVRLVLGGFDVLIAESWEVKTSIFTQPASWHIKMGYGGITKVLINTYPPNTPFQLFVGKALQQTGSLDTPSADETDGATEFSLRGRDALAPLHDDLIDAERSFNVSTYYDLVRLQLDEVGYKNRALAASNRANRKIKAGIPLVELAPVRTVQEILMNTGGTGGTGGISHQQVQARLGEKRYEFIRRYLDMVGLFLWAAADGSFIISEPNANQKAAVRIRRTLNDTRQDTNVERASYSNATEHRYSKYSVYGHGAGRKGNHAKALGSYVDPEMTDWGFVKTKTIHSDNVRTNQQATYLALRQAAEDRRQGFKLTYTLAGHTWAAIDGTGRYTWSPDTVVDLDDQLLGLQGNYYVTDVTFTRAPQTVTEVVLMRPSDLLFGPSEFPPTVAKPDKGGKAKTKVRTVAEILGSAK